MQKILKGVLTGRPFLLKFLYLSILYKIIETKEMR